MRETMTEPLYPSHRYQLWEESVSRVASSRSPRKPLKAVTWCLGDKPCKTLAGPITWVDKRKGR